MSEQKAWGLMQLRGMGTAYYLLEDGSWVANGRLAPGAPIKLWADVTIALRACADYPDEFTDAVQWNVDAQGKPIFFGAKTQTDKKPAKKVRRG